jgi:hypothetical protein
VGAGILTGCFAPVHGTCPAGCMAGCPR